MTVRLLRLDVEGFRGFSSRRSVPLDADAVILAGGNGSGKTSLVDALCWVLTGVVPRLQTEQRFRTDEVVLNRYWSSASATVTLKIRAGDRELSFTRSGSSRGNVLSAALDSGPASGDEAEHALSSLFGFETRDALKVAVDRWVLRQDQLRAVLQASPSELHERLKDLLSLGALDAFESQMKSLAAERSSVLKRSREAAMQADGRLRRGQELLSQVEARVASSPGVEPSVKTLELALAQARPHVLLERRETYSTLGASDLALVRSLYEELRRSGEVIAQTTSELLAVSTNAEPPAISREELADLDEQANLARVGMEELGVRADQLSSQASERARLAAAALPHIGTRCPVCESEIQPELVRDHLQSVIAQEGSTPELAEVRASFLLAQSDLAVLERQLQDQKSVRERADAVARTQTQLEQRMGQEWISIQNAAGAASVSLPSLVGRNLEQINPTLAALALVGQAIRSVVNANQLSELTIARAQAQAEVASAMEDRERSRRELEEASRRSIEGTQLLKATKESVVRVLNRAMARVNPNFSEVYRRLAPHPTFTDLDFDHDVYNNKGRAMPVVVDPLWEIRENPAVVCSVGQLNVIALSYFLAFAMADLHDPMPFVVLDDPLQSLDDVNALGFADYCRRLKADRQLIVTTHDPRFSGLLERKLAPRIPGERSVKINIRSWDRDGPEMDVSESEFAEVEGVA